MAGIGAGPDPRKVAPGMASAKDFADMRVREQDRFLPIANVARIMKRALPPNTKISKEAKETVQECVSEFIAFITSEGARMVVLEIVPCGVNVVASLGAASAHCHRQKRKTINGDDLIASMTALGFDNYIEPITIFQTKFHEHVVCCLRVLQCICMFIPS